MATITVRLDDDIRDALQQKAEDEGVTVSDFVRDLIRESVIGVRDTADDDATAEGFAPASLSPKDRQVLSLLHRILARVLPEDANGTDGDEEYQLERAQVLEDGFTQEYWKEFAGITAELSKRDCTRVMDILDMFRIARYSIEDLAKKGTPVEAQVDDRLQYRGFDFNDSLESKMADYVKFLVDDGRWTEQAEFINGSTGGNSHHRVLDTYLRMLVEYRRIMQSRPRTGLGDYLLNSDELQALSDAWVHPSNRFRD